MRTLYDSTTPAAIPGSAGMVAGYLDPSPWAWSTADWARFPHAVQVQVAVRADTPAGHVLDVERGDATPVQAPGWVQRRRAAGADPSVYCNLSTWPLVIAAFVAARVEQPHYWIAHYDGFASLPTMGGITAVAHQWANQPGGQHYDVSAVVDNWPGVDQKEETMSISPADRAAVALQVEQYKNPADPTDVDVHAHEVDATSALVVVKRVETKIDALTAAVEKLGGGVLAGEASVTVTLSPR